MVCKKKIDSLLDVLFGRHDDIHISLDFELDGIPETHIRRVRHGDHKRLARIPRHIKRYNLVRFALFFGNKLIDFFVQPDGIELYKRNLELAAENVREFLFVDEFQIDEYAAKTFAA